MVKSLLFLLLPGLALGLSAAAAEIPADAETITRFAAPATAEPGGKLAITYHHEGPAFPAEIRLSFAGQDAVVKPHTGKPGENTVELALPSLLPGGDYRVALVTAGSQRRILASAALALPRVVPPVVPRLAGAVIDGDRYTLTFNGGQARKAQARFFAEGKLYAVQRLDEPDGTLSPDIGALARGRMLTVEFRPLPGAADNKIEAAWTRPGDAAPLPKPINYGLFVDGSDVAHPWHMNHDYEYIFDGEPYFPVGGMWGPDTLYHSGNDPAAIEKRMAKDLGVVDELLRHNIDDVYFNIATGSPLWVRQAFIDAMEQKGVYYAYQLNGSGGDTIPSFFITRDRKGAPANHRQLARGVYADGKITAKFPLEQKLAGLLVVDPADPRKGARLASFTDRIGKDLRQPTIDMEKETAFDKQREIVFPLELGLANGAEVVLIPLLEARMHHADLWDETRFATIKERIAWIGHLRWGPRMRGFIDPLVNETHMTNGTENLRQYTDAINRTFAGYLRDRYGTVERLRQEWAVAVDGFDAAARLVPLRLGDRLWLIDPMEGKTFACDPAQTFAWLDYQNMIRESYADRADEMAVYIKTLVDVPVVYKNVGVVAEKTHISRRYLGTDGIGFEIYFHNGVNPNGASGGATRAAAEISSHTLWKVGTELGHSAEKMNSGVKFFKDEAEIRLMAERLAQMGARGFYFFGIDLKPPGPWGGHNFHDFPEGQEWVERLERDYARPAAKLPAVTANYYSFPEGYNDWWWTTRYKAVYDYEGNPISRSVRLSPETPDWFSSTSVVPQTFGALLVSCPKPPFSRYHAADIARAIASGQPVYYVGDREDLGSIPELDRFFDRETLRFDDGSTARVLRAEGGAEVLASQKGKPWAVRAGNLTVVSRIPAASSSRKAGDQPRYLAQLLENAQAVPRVPPN